jgi:hypothetical protein
MTSSETTIAPAAPLRSALDGGFVAVLFPSHHVRGSIVGLEMQGGELMAKRTGQPGKGS